MKIRQSFDNFDNDNNSNNNNINNNNNTMDDDTVQDKERFARYEIL